MAIPNVIADFSTILALKVAVGATTATLVSATDSDGVALPTGTYGFTIDRKNSSKEYITATLTGTALTDIKTIAVGTGIATAGFARAHRRSAEVVLTDFVAIKRIQDVLETGYDYSYSPSTDYQLSTKKYVDDLALGGATTVDRVTVVATAGETVSAGHLVYLKLSDSRWWKCDADDATTVDNVVLGIAMGSGTAGNAITSGVLIKGVYTTTGLTANSLYYASNTAGAYATTTGTFTRIIGIATSTTKLYFDPDFNKVYKDYAVDSVGTDSYAITLQSAFGALYAGMEVTFKAGTANTGACTLAVNGLTAKAITKYGTTALATGDIVANQIVKVVYDGTQFQMVSSIPVSTNPTAQAFSSATGMYTAPTGLKYVIVEAVGGGGAGACANTNQSGDGGGAGAYGKWMIPAASIGATQAVTIGAGGIGSTAGIGPSGGDTSLGTLCIAGGGKGGVTRDAGGNGGTAGAASGSATLMFSLAVAGGAGGNDTSATPDVLIQGKGASTPWGDGGMSMVGVAGGAVAGKAGKGYGAGGSSSISSSNAGGSGANGYMLITEYY